MATITAKNIGRINVWPTYAVAREADTAESKFTGQLTVWRTNEEAKANISHEEGGGGGGQPAWVPANAVIHIDLVGGSPQGRAWMAGTGEVAVDALLGADANTENAWGPSGYDPVYLTADGYVTDGQLTLAFIGVARSLALDAATLVVRLKFLTDNSQYPFAVMSADGNDGVQIQLNADAGIPELGVIATSWGGLFHCTITDIVNFDEATEVGLNCCATTITSTRFDMAVNGSDAVAGSLASDDRPTDNQLVAAVCEGGVSNAIQSITLYDPLPSTAGLSELSEV